MYARVKCAKISLMELQFNANCKMKKIFDLVCAWKLNLLVHYKVHDIKGLYSKMKPTVAIDMSFLPAAQANNLWQLLF